MGWELARPPARRPPPARPQGVLVRPGTPRDPKTNLFATKWVAVPPFGTWRPPEDAEKRCGSHLGGGTPSISIFLTHFGPPK